MPRHQVGKSALILLQAKSFSNKYRGARIETSKELAERQTALRMESRMSHWKFSSYTIIRTLLSPFESIRDRSERNHVQTVLIS